VEHAALPVLVAWESFYVIIGSSAAALTGLQFVVIVLGAEVNALGAATAIRAFGSPTIVHFCVVLLIAAIMTAPWHALSPVALALGASGIGGLVYGIVVVRHARRQTDYVPVLEDQIWHFTLPLLAYASLLVASVVLSRHAVESLFVIGAAALLLLFIGIHNAWDAVTYMASKHREAPEPAERK
jgi:hypothetical protein